MKKMKIIRKDSLYHFGFGTDEMMNLTVCTNCNSLEESNKIFCSKCGTRLSGANLYDLYKSYHKICSKCGMVISPSMHYCPHCGIRVKATPELCVL
ncbi:MAG: zinc ribbon domain-containing protein [Clostridia bacterium]|nr:zinc ribbon domain-containing protein [Clostridia bacterium]